MKSLPGLRSDYTVSKIRAEMRRKHPHAPRTIGLVLAHSCEACLSSRRRRASATCICRRAIRDCSQEPWRCPHSVSPWDRGGTPTPERRPTLTTRYLPIAPGRALPSMARQVGGTGTGNGAWRLCRCGLSCRMFLLSRRPPLLHLCGVLFL